MVPSLLKRIHEASSQSSHFEIVCHRTMDASWALGNADILQSIATLVWCKKDDPGLTEQLTTARLGYEMWARLSGERDVEALRNHTIAEIVKYINSHPNAKKEDLQEEIAKQIAVFASQVDKL